MYIYSSFTFIKVKQVVKSIYVEFNLAEFDLFFNITMYIPFVFLGMEMESRSND